MNSFIENVNYLASLDNNYGDGVVLNKSNLSLRNVANDVTLKFSYFNYNTRQIETVTKGIQGMLYTGLETALQEFVAQIEAILGGNKFDASYTISSANTGFLIHSFSITINSLDEKLKCTEINFNAKITSTQVEIYNLYGNVINPLKLLSVLAMLEPEVVNAIPIVYENIDSIICINSNIDLLNDIKNNIIPNINEILEADNNALIASQKALDASASALSALEFKNSANSSAEIAIANADESELNASSALSSATLATTKANEASASATSASTSATNASASSSTATTQATNAATSATSASTSATSAATSATASTAKASEASTSASNAALSATNSANSAISANASATIATTKASEALASEISASTSSNIATTKADEASVSASSALSSKNAAAISEINSANSESSASNSAELALEYKNSAFSSSTSAENSASAAINNANASLLNANNASSSATNASISESNSLNSANLAAEKANSILNLDVEMTELPHGSDPTTVFNPGSGVLTIGIPEIIDGKDGSSVTNITSSKVGKTTTVNQYIDGVLENTFTVNDGLDGVGIGDMLASTYDTNNNGIVDNSEKVNGLTVKTAVPANAVFTDTVYDDTAILSAIETKQDTLVSGTNIKTVNSSSILGSGNLALLTSINPVITGSITEQVYNLTGTAINPANGTIQYKTVSANTTFTETLTSGQSVLLRLIGASNYTITFPTITWAGAAAPVLTANCAIVLWKEQSTLYGSFVGTLV